MNEVYLEGVIVAVVQPEHATTAENHLVLQVCVTHCNKQRQLKKEQYMINAWNRLADWAQLHIKPGMPVLVKGYLTQHTYGHSVVTEITASRFVPLWNASVAHEALRHSANG